MIIWCKIQIIINPLYKLKISLNISMAVFCLYICLFHNYNNFFKNTLFYCQFHRYVTFLSHTYLNYDWCVFFMWPTYDLNYIFITAQRNKQVSSHFWCLLKSGIFLPFFYIFCNFNQNNDNYVQLYPGIYRDKTMAEKFMYKSNDDTQTYPFFR